MTVLATVAPHETVRSTLDLATLLARSAGEEVVVGTVVTTPWPRGMDSLDEGYAAELDRSAQEALASARASMPDDLTVRFEVERARSVSSGLLRMAERTGARMLVLGSATRGPYGYIQLGGGTDSLMYSSPIATALTPRGYSCPPEGVLSRVSVAYGGPDSDPLVKIAAGYAARMGATLRLVSFAIRARTILTAGVGSRAEMEVLEEWRRSIAAEQEAVISGLDGGLTVESTIARGHTWNEAMDDIAWSPAEVIAVGSSSLGPVSRVFLGSRAAKLVRSAPVPVIAVPRAQEPRDPGRRGSVS